ncbi:response regulator [Methylobacterium soli]|uniref:Response regulator transcription factor n=1 Tax=Methylobacterium soli TaxID=553447 RepID=A0A6L3SNZ6_9HYPH|nr:response regulator transcription factor [Methylobacterium soli]KAB1070367.1 response regulator transcription factor [Methylobacterium soli]GJE41257.1 Transcriptional regulatory protein DegU [Methylobacterium soli]
MTGEAKVTIVVADDHPVVLSGLAMLLNRVPGNEVIAACADGASALQKIEELEPTIACLDISMPRLRGLDVLRIVRERGLKTRIVILTASTDEKELIEAAACGAWAVLHKESAADALVGCLETVAAGRRWTWVHQAGCAAKMSADLVRDTRISKAAFLTPREQEITQLVSEGLSNKDIARATHISEGTVKIHLYNIYQKLGISNRTSLASYAHQIRASSTTSR